MKALYRIAFGLLLLGCALVPTGSLLAAEGEAAPPPSAELTYIPKSAGIIEQAISVHFKPVSVYALVERKFGEVRQYPGVAVPTGTGTTEVEAGQTVTVGAIIPVPVDAKPDEVFHFTFFLASVTGEFAATEIRSWTWKNLRANSLTEDSLESQGALIAAELPAQR